MGSGMTKEQATLEGPRDAWRPVDMVKTLASTLDRPITKTAMTRYFRLLKQLGEICGNDAAARFLLRILDAVGRYLGSGKRRRNPQANRVLQTACAGLERVVSSGGRLESGEKRKILDGAKAEFARLREQVASGDGVGARKKTAASPAPCGGGRRGGRCGGGVEKRQIMDAVGEIKATIAEEIGLLRREVEALRSGIKPE